MPDRHILIVGGGIVGVSAAYFLARRGVRVTLLERDTIDDSASTGNAGLVAVGHGPLPRPGLWWRSLGWMLRPTSPLLIVPRAHPREMARLLAWLWGFHRACETGHHDRSLDALAAHGHPAGACFRSLVAEAGIACELRDVGQMDVYRTERGLRAGEAEAAAFRRRGYESETIPGPELRRREPGFRSDVVGAILHRDRAFANPGAFVRGVADRATALGAVVRTQTPVTELVDRDDRCAGVVTAAGERIEADAVLLAAGVWSSRLAAGIGVRIPMQPGKGYHLELATEAPPLSTASVLAESFVAATPMDGALRLAGTLEFSGINHRLRRRRLEQLRTSAARYLAGLERLEVRAEWCGLRPCTADGLPVIGWAPRRRDLFVATGHAMMGFALGPLAGHVAAGHLLGDEPDVDLDPFAVDRYARPRRPRTATSGMSVPAPARR